jgi:hypothetical protein
MTEIETSRLLLRRWREGDLDAYARICADPEVMRYLPATLGREESAEQMAWFERHWEERGFGLWAVEEKASGEFIGFIGLVYHDGWPEGEHKTEVGWRLGRAHWGRGLATEGALASVRYGFEGLGLAAHHQHHATGERRLAARDGEGRAHLPGRDALARSRRDLVRDRPRRLGGQRLKPSSAPRRGPGGFLL